MGVCNMDCIHCVHSDCINDSDVLTLQERETSSDLDYHILTSRGLSYSMTEHKRQNKEKDPVLYRQAQNRHFHKKYYTADPEKYRRKSRENYHKHKEVRLAQHKEYYEANKVEILSQKKSYYEENKEVILAQRKENYVPHPKEVIDTPQAQRKREMAKLRYEQKKDEINRKRREKRKENKNATNSKKK